MNSLSGIKTLNRESVMLLQCAEQLDVDRKSLVGRMPFPSDWLRIPGRRIPIEVQNWLWNRLAELTDDPHVGLRVAELVDGAAVGGVLHHIAETYASLDEAFGFIVEQAPLMMDRLQFDVIVAREDVTVRLVHPELDKIGCRHNIEFTWAIFLNAFRRRLGVTHLPSVCRIASYRSEAASTIIDEKRLALSLGAAIELNAPFHELVVPREGWFRVTKPSQPDLREYLLVALNEARAAIEQPDPVAEKVVRHLMLIKGMHTATCTDVAAALGMSSRTLRRYLASEGTSFRRVHGLARLRQAEALLCETEQSLTEVALKVGFSEQSAFTRAFKRWTGVTPGRYRQDNQSLS